MNNLMSYMTDDVFVHMVYIYVDSEYCDRYDLKSKGARWDSDKRKWYFRYNLHGFINNYSITNRNIKYDTCNYCPTDIYICYWDKCIKFVFPNKEVRSYLMNIAIKRFRNHNSVEKIAKMNKQIEITNDIHKCNYKAVISTNYHSCTPDMLSNW